MASRFVKRSTSAVIPERTDNSFRFNFQVDMDKPSENTRQASSSGFLFHSSDNSFRFNFTET